MIRGSYISKNDLQGQQIFPINLISKDAIKDNYIRKFVTEYFSENKQIDKTTGYIFEGIHEQVPILHRYRLKVYMIREMLYFDKMFIDGDKILFMNTETNNIRRINPERIQMVSFEEVQTISLTNL